MVSAEKTGKTGCAAPGKISRILLCGVFGPFGIDDEYGRKENLMELYHNHVTRIYRKDTLEYPEDALREALIDAVIHRSYIGAHTQLKIYPDTLNLWNNGGLPAGWLEYRCVKI